MATKRRSFQDFSCTINGTTATYEGNGEYARSFPTLAAAKPTITTQPQNVTAYVGKTAYFKVVANAATGYQWQWSKDGGATWKDSTSATTGYNKSTLEVSATADRNGYKYRCKVYNVTDAVYSKTVTLKVKK